jgi:hypothetical protein
MDARWLACRWKFVKTYAATRCKQKADSINAFMTDIGYSVQLQFL